MNGLIEHFPRIMGIVNITPDSFSDGGKFLHRDAAISHALRLIEDGADILDFGGESSRPGAESVSVEEELRRVVPVIKAVHRAHPHILLSIDTVKYDVARAAVEAGAGMINDISALHSDPRLAELAAEYTIPLVLMHMQGTPRTMQKNSVYEDVVQEVFDFLATAVARARGRGATKIFADVGIGFGKTVEHNLTLMAHHAAFAELDVPMVLGLSRKSFIGKLLDIPVAADRDLPTLILHLLLQNARADIIRVHNVKMFAQARTLAHALRDAGKV